MQNDSKRKRARERERERNHGIQCFAKVLVSFLTAGGFKKKEKENQGLALVQTTSTGVNTPASALLTEPSLSKIKIDFA